MSKKQLLVCMPDFPFPARKNGISIRYYPILEHASKNFDIHLVVIANSQVGTESITEAEAFCKKVSVYVRRPHQVSLFTKLKARVKSLFPIGIPFDQLYFDENEIVEFINKETAGKIYDTALCVLITHQHLVQRLVKAKHYSLDVIDSPYSTCLRTCGKSPLKVYDALMVKYWERRAIHSVDYASYISPLDRKIGAGENIDGSKIGIIPNGLYLNDFSNEKVEFGCTTVGYLGHMGYPPNIRAALRLYAIFKAKKHALSNSKLVIIGRDPAPEILELSQDPDVIITGTVENIWPFVNGINIFVFPMEIGSGQQNKLLEAMGAAKPVISSSLGNSGINATHLHEIITANTDEDIGNALVELVANPSLAMHIGENAKLFTEKTYSWNAIHKLLDASLLK